MRSFLPLALLAVAALPLGAQQAATGGWRGRLRVAVGAVSGSTWLEDANGVDVTSGVGPTLGAEYRLPSRGRTEYDVGLRASRASTTVSSRAEYDADAMYVVDAFLGARRQVHPLVAIRGGAVAAYVGGGSVAPFTEATRIAPGLEAGVAVRLGARLPLELALGAQVLRYGGSGRTPTGSTAGAVPRILLELRHGR